MAAFYELRYWKNFTQPDGSIIRLEIHGKGIEGVSMTAYEIGPVVQALALNIQGQTDDVDAPIVKTSLSMTFVDAPDHADAWLKKCGDWEEFYTNDSTYWKVLIKAKKNASSASYAQLWGGYITPDSFSEELRYRGSVTIVARDNIGHMQDFPFDAEGDENGLISLKELVETAWAKIESPMSLYWPAARWLECEGVYAFDTRMNVSAFKDMNWYDAVEKALYSYGAVMRYNGENQVLLCSLRYMPQQARPSMDQVAHIEPIFIAHAQRELIPAARRIEEVVNYDIEDYIFPKLSETDFTGGTESFLIDGNSVDYKGVAWTIKNKISGLGWCCPDYSMFFNPSAYSFYIQNGNDDDFNFLVCNTYDLEGNIGYRYAEFSRQYNSESVRLDLKFGQPYAFNINGELIPSGSLETVTVAIIIVQDGINKYLQKDMTWGVSEFAHILPADNLGIDIPPSEFSGSLMMKVQIHHIKTTGAAKSIASYIPLYRASFSVNSAILQKNTVNTKYQNSNNVILSRDPEIAPAYNTVALPGFIKNGIFYYDGNVIMPAKAWSWNGGTPQQMAVYNHLQLLCYHSKPNNLITGDIVNADVIKTAAIYVWGGKEHLLISGTYNYLNGRIEGAVLREFVRYDDMWGEVSGTSLPDTEQSSTTNQEGSGASSGPSSTNENTTNVVIGGEGGGSVTIDPFLSDTSSNPVESKAIKAYIDSADNEIKERLAALEEGSDVDHPVFEFTYDTTTNKATAEMVAALAEAIADNKLILCNGRTYKFILEQDGMYGLVSDAYMDIMTGKLKTSVLAVMSSSYDVQLAEEEVPVGTEITEATISGWGFTKNAGTITGIKMNGATKGTSGVVDLGNVLTEHQKLKDINGQSIVGEGNITIQGGGATPRVEMTASTAVLQPNTFHVWPMMDSLDLTLGAEQSGVMNRYLFQFRCPKESLTILSLPAEVMWSEDVELDDNGLPVMDATAYYRVEVIENLATLKKWKLAYMQFADAEVEKALSEAIGDELGVPVNVAKNLKTFGAWLRGNIAAKTFHEFEQFAKLETIEQNAFNGCTNLAMTFPPNVKSIGTAAFSQAEAFVETLALPALEELGDYAFRLTRLKKVEDLGKIVILPGNNSSTNSATFGGCSSLTFVRLPASLQQLGSSVNPASPFRGCSSLINVISEAVTPPSMLVLAFEDCPSTLAIYVPDESVEAYKGAMNWSHYMSRIRPVSDYELSAVIFTFKDAAVQAVMLANWDGNGDGQLSKAEVQSITTLNRKFKGNATIVDCSDFDALTGLTYLLGGYNNGEFYNCTSLRFFAIPPNCKELQYYAFQKCTALESVTGLEYVETMGLSVFDSCTSLVINELRMPNLKGTLRANVFTATTMTRAEDLGAITHIAETGYNKGVFPKTLQFLRLPSTLTDITSYAFQINTNLQTVICEAVVPPTAAQGIFNGSNSPIYVPDESVEAYKAAVNWNAYADRIKGISEYTG